jgi:hypothetical protein
MRNSIYTPCVKIFQGSVCNSRIVKKSVSLLIFFASSGSWITPSW